MGYIKKLRESRKILDAAGAAITEHELLSAHIQELMQTQDKLMKNARALIDLHRQMMDNMDVKEVDVEQEFDVPLRVHTTHGIFAVGIACPDHKIVHSDRGEWYICVDGGRVDVTGWHRGN